MPGRRRLYLVGKQPPEPPLPYVRLECNVTTGNADILKTMMARNCTSLNEQIAYCIAVTKKFEDLVAAGDRILVVDPQGTAATVRLVYLSDGPSPAQYPQGGRLARWPWWRNVVDALRRRLDR